MRFDFRTLVIGFVVGVVMAGMGIAIAGNGSDPPPSLTGEDVVPIPVADPPTPAEPGAVESPEPNRISADPDPPEMIAECRAKLRAGVTGPELTRCQIVVARADGRLEPGYYSDAELEEALRNAT